MNISIRIERAEADPGRLNDHVASLVKGMLKRGDKQSDIAACFLLNSGRIAEINKGKRFSEAVPAQQDELPPAGPYPSPYELMQSKRELWRVRAALEAAEDAVRQALVVIHKIEQR